VDPNAYLREASRLLRPAGSLITSADFWPEKIDTDECSPYNLSWKIFTKEDIEGIIATAANFGLNLIEPIDFTCKEPVIEWRGKKYTVIFFILKKQSI